mgnify:CR=1 FL=1
MPDHVQKKLLWIIVVAIGVSACINISSAFYLPFFDRAHWLSDYLSFDFQYGSRVTNVGLGFLLLLLANQILNRKWVAWWLVQILLILSILTELTQGLEYESALYHLVLFVLLLPLRKYFTAASDPPTLRKMPYQVVGLLSVFILFGVGCIYLLDNHFNTPFSLTMSLRNTITGLVFLNYSNLDPITRHGQFFIDTLYMLGVLWYGYTLFLLLRPVLPYTNISTQEKMRAAALIAEHGYLALHVLALLPDKHYFFHKNTVIAYTMKAGVALVLGDPIGPISEMGEVLEEFASYCQKNDWKVALYQVTPERLQFYTNAGYKSLVVGQEAVVNLHTFTTQGHQGKEFRYVVHKLEKAGYSVSFLSHPIDKSTLTELDRVSSLWLEERSGSELYFSLGWFSKEYLETSTVLVVKDAMGSIQAFCTLLTGYNNTQVAVDLMRKLPTAPPGCMDYLFVQSMLWAQSQGYAFFDMGLSALSGVKEDKSNQKLVTSALEFVYHSFSQFYNFHGLHTFKAKFNPIWQPRYLVYQSALQLPVVAMALVQAHTHTATWKPST